MTDRDSELAHEKSAVRIDRETLEELITLSKRTIDTFGLIAPVLELAREEYELDQVWHFSAAEVLSLEGREAMEKFTNLCKILCFESTAQASPGPGAPPSLKYLAPGRSQ